MTKKKIYCKINKSKAQLAQLVEQRTENPRVSGSIPELGIEQMICGCSSMVEHQPSKLDTWVRFPSPALSGNQTVSRFLLFFKFFCIHFIQMITDFI